MNGLKRTISYTFAVIVLSFACIAAAFADNSIAVGKQNGSVCFLDEADAVFSVQGELQGRLEVQWLQDEPSGVDWSYDTNAHKLTFRFDWEKFSRCGEYSFVVKCGEAQSEERTLTVAPKKVRFPETVGELTYNGVSQSVVKNMEDSVVVTGTAEARNAGEYEAVVSLPDRDNYVWNDGSSEPVNVQWKILPVVLKISGVKVLDKYCDGTDRAEFDNSELKLEGLVEGDSVQCVFSGSFLTPKVGSGKTVNYTVELSGEDSRNYCVSDDSMAPLTAAIYKAKSVGCVEYIPDSASGYKDFTLLGTGDELIEAALDSEKLELVSNGADVKIWFSAVDITDNPPAGDFSKIQAAKGNATVAAYMDLNILYSVGEDGDAGKIPELNNEVEIRFEIPKSLQSKSLGVSRSFDLIRVHNGVAENIDVEYNPKDNTVKFSTDKFSTYALVYEDIPIEGFVNPVLENDGDFTVLYAMAVAASLFFAIRQIFIAAFRKYEETAYVGKHHS